MGLVNDAVATRKLNLKGESQIKKMFIVYVGIGLMGGRQEVLENCKIKID